MCYNTAANSHVTPIGVLAHCMDSAVAAHLPSAAMPCQACTDQSRVRHCAYRDDSEIVLPKLGFGPQTTRSSVVRCSVARLSAHDSRLPANPTAADPMYVCLRPKDWEGESSVLPITPTRSNEARAVYASAATCRMLCRKVLPINLPKY